MKRLKLFLSSKYTVFKVFKRSNTKIFIIGRNKTGTTSIRKSFKDLGYIVGDQRRAELLYSSYMKSDFNPIIDYCRTAEVFQDYPFSYSETYKHMDKAFPKSKFILTIRDSAEQWYDSLTNAHSKKFGKEGSLPTKRDLKNTTYVEKGWMWKIFSFFYNPPDLNDIYNKENLIETYNNHNNEILKYFKNRPEDLLVLNIGKNGAYQKFIDFIGVESPIRNFPWENKTDQT